MPHNRGHKIVRETLGTELAALRCGVMSNVPPVLNPGTIKKEDIIHGARQRKEEHIECRSRGHGESTKLSLASDTAP
jgi:hypothetical protein